MKSKEIKWIQNVSEMGNQKGENDLSITESDNLPEGNESIKTVR